ncbi:MAG: hypothetical protein HY050_02680 [Actinobacteria bacterium]|nr:hypothetical protein [Actinomycetota bacterium]
MDLRIAIVATMSGENANKSTRRAIVATLLRIEAAMVLSLGIFLVVSSLISTPEAPAALIAEVLFAILGSVGLAAAAHGFSKGRNYGRAPAILANFIALGVSTFQMEADLWLLAIPFALLALVTLLLALSITPE